MKLITIGRHPSNEVIIDDKYVGRNHLQIMQDDDGNFILSDLGSANGTFVNGKKVTGEMLLKPTDIIRIGSTTLPWKAYFQEKKQSEIKTPEVEEKPSKIKTTIPSEPEIKPSPQPKPPRKPFPWRTIASVITTIVGLLMALITLYVMLSKL